MSLLIIHTDGGSRGNPGPAATGVVMLIDGAVVSEEGKYLGLLTNNDAEYQAVIHSLELLPEVIKKYSVDTVEWRLDSMLVVQQLSKKWKIKEPRLAKYATSIWQTLSTLSVKSSFTYVPRAQNSAADAVVNQTLDAEAQKAE